MKRFKSALIVIFYIGFLVLGFYLWGLWGKKSPALPVQPELIKIVLYEVYPSKVSVEKIITDRDAIQGLLDLFTKGESCGDHKCASVGDIYFISGDDSKVLNVLPGHDLEMYEFRYNGRMFCLPRESYIDGLMSVGVAREDVVLDAHAKKKVAEVDAGF